MRFTTKAEFEAGITNDDIRQVFNVAWNYYEGEPRAAGFVVFGSYGSGSFKDDSDIDIALLYRDLPEVLIDPPPEMKQELNRFVRYGLLQSLPSLKQKKLLTVFAFLESKWEELYGWDNSIAHGIMGGLMLDYRGNTGKFKAKVEELQDETPLNIRRYE